MGIRHHARWVGLALLLGACGGGAAPSGSRNPALITTEGSPPAAAAPAPASPIVASSSVECPPTGARDGAAAGGTPEQLFTARLLNSRGPVPIEYLARDAELIVVGRVAQLGAEQGDPRAWSVSPGTATGQPSYRDATIAVERIVKGQPASCDVTVRIPGFYAAQGAVPLSAGERVLLFLVPPRQWPASLVLPGVFAVEGKYTLGAGDEVLGAWPFPWPRDGAVGLADVLPVVRSAAGLGPRPPTPTASQRPVETTTAIYHATATAQAQIAAARQSSSPRPLGATLWRYHEPPVALGPHAPRLPELAAAVERMLAIEVTPSGLVVPPALRAASLTTAHSVELSYGPGTELELGGRRVAVERLLIPTPGYISNDVLLFVDAGTGYGAEPLRAAYARAYDEVSRIATELTHVTVQVRR